MEERQQRSRLRHDCRGDERPCIVQSTLRTIVGCDISVGLCLSTQAKMKAYLRMCLY